MIGVYIRPPGLTKEQYDAVDRQAREAGIVPNGLKLHTLFGEGANLGIFDVWESEEDFFAYVTQLGPMMTANNVEVATPSIMPILVYEAS